LKNGRETSWYLGATTHNYQSALNNPTNLIHIIEASVERSQHGCVLRLMMDRIIFWVSRSMIMLPTL
jgi:hypothetical protein